MKVLIVEDEETASKRLEKLLKEIVDEVVICKVLDTVADSISFLRTNHDFELIFLDIQLADGLSFEIFEQVKIHVPVIFTTAYDQYALKAFELNSIDYLLKPIDKNKLEKSLQKFHQVKEHFSSDDLGAHIQQLMNSYPTSANQYKTRFLIPKADELIPVHVDDIAFFYTEDKVVFLVTNEAERYMINFSLDQIEQSVDPALFFRINRHQIVASTNIKKIHNYFNYRLKLALEIELEQEFIVSKAKVSEFKNWLS